MKVRRDTLKRGGIAKQAEGYIQERQEMDDREKCINPKLRNM